MDRIAREFGGVTELVKTFLKFFTRIWFNDNLAISSVITIGIVSGANAAGVVHAAFLRPLLTKMTTWSMPRRQEPHSAVS